MKYFVVADVHGYFPIMKRELDAAGFDPNNSNHMLISCGDLMDRGAHPEKCLEYMLSLPQKILICGNHETLMEQAIIRQEFLSHDISNGTAETATVLTNTPDPDLAVLKMRDCAPYNDYIHQLYWYYETKNYIFVHGWIPCINQGTMNKHQYVYSSDWRMQGAREWQQATWTNGMEAWMQGVREPNKTIVCGHFHCTWGKHYIDKTSPEWPNRYSTNPAHRELDWTPYTNEGIIALDACTALSHKINVLVIEDEELV